MIETITVTGLHEVDVAVSTNPKINFWLTTVDPEDEYRVSVLGRHFIQKGISHKVVYFKDFDDGEWHADVEGPSMQDLVNIIGWLDAIKNADVVAHLGINCYAGVSRSAALAMIGWMRQGYSPEVALEKVLSVRSQALPLGRLLRFYDELYKTNALAVVKQYKQMIRGHLWNFD